MPWYVLAALMVGTGVVSGLVVWTVSRKLGRQQARLEVEMSDIASFDGSSGKETFQSISVTNRGNAAATNLAVTVDGLPEGKNREHSVHSTESDPSVETDEGKFVLRQPRLLGGDRVEIAFKFVNVKSSLDLKQVDARADQGKAVPRGATGESGSSWVGSALGVAIPLAVIIVLWWVVPRLSSGQSLLPQSEAHRMTRIRHLEEKGDFDGVARVLRHLRPRAKLSLTWSDAEPSWGDSVLLTVVIINGELFPMTDVLFSIDLPGLDARRGDSWAPNAWSARFADVAMNDTTGEQVWVRVTRGWMRPTHLVKASMLYECLGERRHVETQSWVKFQEN